MSEILVLCPSRGRPDAAAALLESFLATAQDPATRLLFAVDADDPALPRYLALFDVPWLLVLPASESGDYVRATNSAAARFWARDLVIGNVSDDHRFRTPGWDRAIGAALERPGIAYGDDGYQGPNLPTSVFVSSAICRALGWFALPGCRHLYVDNAWKALGEALGVLRYLPAVLIEHMHWSYGKSEFDEGYARVQDPAAIAADYAAYTRWLSADLADDVVRVGDALRVAA